MASVVGKTGELLEASRHHHHLYFSQPFPCLPEVLSPLCPVSCVLCVLYTCEVMFYPFVADLAFQQKPWYFCTWMCSRCPDVLLSFPLNLSVHFRMVSILLPQLTSSVRMKNSPSLCSSPSSWRCSSPAWTILQGQTASPRWLIPLLTLYSQMPSPYGVFLTRLGI